MKKMTIFASQTQFFPESGSGKRFRASGVRVIDIKLPLHVRGIIFLKVFKS